MTTPPKFAVRIHQGGYDFPYIRDIAVRADALGYHAVSLYDLLSIPTLECWTTLAALAAQTRRIHLIPLTLANLYRHPATLAKMAATLSAVSGGRLTLGIGAGGGERDHRAYGIPYPPMAQRAAMLDEAVALIRLLWTGERVTFEGAYYRLDNAICQPAPLPPPPILIGGHGEKHLLRVAAARADITNMSADMTIAEHQAKRQVLAAHCRAAGRSLADIQISHNARVFIGKDNVAVDALLRHQAARQGIPPDEFSASLGGAIVGTPRQCAIQLQPYIDYGIRYFFLLFPEPISTAHLELFATEVMPQFA